MRSCRKLIFDPNDAFDDTEVFPSAVVLHCEQAPCVRVLWMYIDNEVLQVFNFFCALVMVRQQFSDQLFFVFFQWDIVGVSAKNVFEKTLEFVDIIVSFPTKVEGFDFFVFGLIFLFFLDFFFMALFEIFDDGIVMVSVLLPEFTERISFSFLDDELAVSDFESFFFKSFDDFGLGIFLIKGEVSLSFVESNVGREDILIFQQGFLNVLERYGLLFFDTDGEDDAE